MSKDLILQSFGKYLNTMSHLWNEAYYQNSFADQDTLVAIQIGKFLEKTGFTLSPQDPYHVGIKIPFFSETRCYGALYAQDTNPITTELFNEILSVPSKADLVSLGHDLTDLSVEDTEL